MGPKSSARPAAGTAHLDNCPVADPISPTTSQSAADKIQGPRRFGPTSCWHCTSRQLPTLWDCLDAASLIRDNGDHAHHAGSDNVFFAPSVARPARTINLRAYLQNRSKETTRAYSLSRLSVVALRHFANSADCFRRVRGAPDKYPSSSRYSPIYFRSPAEPR